MRSFWEIRELRDGGSSWRMATATLSADSLKTVFCEWLFFKNKFKFLIIFLEGFDFFDFLSYQTRS